MSRQEPTYEECYALILLQECLGIFDLELSDRPDIKCNNQFGIEVVSALFEDEKRLETIYSRKLAGKKTDPIPEGYVETRYFTIHPKMVTEDWMKTSKYDRSMSDAVELIKKAMDKKSKKVSSYDLETNRLFVFTELCIDEDTLKSIGRDLYQYTQNTFQVLYILVRDANCLMVCTSDSISLYYHEKEQFSYSMMAKELWEGGHVNE